MNFVFIQAFMPYSPQCSVRDDYANDDDPLVSTHLFGVVLFPLSSDTSAGPSSEYGGLLLLTPLTPLHTSIMVNFVGPRMPADRNQGGKRKG